MDNHLPSADELFERALIELYSQWYRLPRLSTAPELDAARQAAAGSLAALPAQSGVVPAKPMKEILVAFGLTALELPKCEEFAGDTLRSLTGPTLKSDTVNSTARVDQLVAWLRADEPFLYVLGKMHYAPERAERAWQQIWLRVKIVVSVAKSVSRMRLSASP